MRFTKKAQNRTNGVDGSSMNFLEDLCPFRCKAHRRKPAHPFLNPNLGKFLKAIYEAKN